VKNVPEDGSDGLKHVAQCCTALKCYVWRCTLFLFYTGYTTGWIIIKLQ